MYLKYSVILLILLKFHNYSGCSSQSDDKPHLSPPGYDMNVPGQMGLPSELDNISGICYYPRDTSLFAVVNGDGMLYKISLHRQAPIMRWRFDKNKGYEDIVMKDSTFYLLAAEGSITTLRFEGDSTLKTEMKLADADKSANEFKSLYYDDDYKKLVMLCRKCDGDPKKTVSAWGYSIDSQRYNSVLFSIDTKTIIEKSGDKMRFQPAGSAINPITNELYLLDPDNKLLVIIDRAGKVKDVFNLNPEIYKQPEGIAFTPNGDMIISNGGGGSGKGDILVIKRSK